MKITALESFILDVPTTPPIALQYPRHRLVCVRIATSEGVTGFGYTLVFGGGAAEAIEVYLQTRLKPLLLLEDPLFIERLWQKMYNGDRGIKRQGIAAYAVSAVDIALWDLAGKVAGLPLYQLWGAVTDRVPAYGSGGWPAYTLEDLITEAQGYVARGCRSYKLKIHDEDPRKNRQRVEALQKALGDDVRLMVDINQRLSVIDNIRQAKLLEDFDLIWYEEPVSADNLAGCAEVARSINIPVASGENNHTRYEFRELIERNAVRYVQPDVGRANGFSETLRIGRLAGAHDVLISPHLVHELSVQVAGALDNAFAVELVDWTPDDLFVGMPVLEDGCFRLTDRPGHGIELHPDAERRYGQQ